MSKTSNFRLYTAYEWSSTVWEGRDADVVTGESHKSKKQTENSWNILKILEILGKTVLTICLQKGPGNLLGILGIHLVKNPCQI